MSLDFQKEHYFRVIAQTQSITQAAELLHVSQPALSKTIRQMEKDYGCTLFDHVGRNIVLNDNGALLLRYVDRALRSMNIAAEKLKEHERQEEQTVNLAPLAPTGAPGFAFSLLKQTAPDIIIKLLYLPETEQKEPYDLEFFATAKEVSGDNVRFICREEYVAVLPNGHPLANRASIRLADLREERFIVPMPSENSDIVIGMCAEAGFEPKITAMLQIYVDVLGFVHHGLGVCVAPRATWLAGYSTEFAVIPLSDIHRTRNLYLRWPADRYVSEATKRVGRFLQSYFMLNASGE